MEITVDSKKRRGAGTTGGGARAGILSGRGRPGRSGLFDAGGTPALRLSFYGLLTTVY